MTLVPHCVQCYAAAASGYDQPLLCCYCLIHVAYSTGFFALVLQKKLLWCWYQLGQDWMALYPFPQCSPGKCCHEGAMRPPM